MSNKHLDRYEPLKKRLDALPVTIQKSYPITTAIKSFDLHKNKEKMKIDKMLNSLRRLETCIVLGENLAASEDWTTLEKRFEKAKEMYEHQTPNILQERIVSKFPAHLFQVDVECDLDVLERSLMKPKQKKRERVVVVNEDTIEYAGTLLSSMKRNEKMDTILTEYLEKEMEKHKEGKNNQYGFGKLVSNCEFVNDTLMKEQQQEVMDPKVTVFGLEFATDDPVLRFHQLEKLEKKINSNDDSPYL